MKHSSRGFEALGYIVLGIFSISCLLPFVMLLSGSFTAEVAITRNGYRLFPSEFGTDAWKFIVNKIPLFSGAIIRSLAVTFLGTIIHTILASTLAYPLSKPDLPGRSVLSFLVILTLLLNGGLVPTYIVYTHVFNIKNTFWALLVPSLLMNGFNVTLMRNYYTQSIPASMLEAARIDGAKEHKIFTSVVLPCSKPMLTTISLMAALVYWNDWNNGLYYITDERKMGLQSILNSIVQNAEFLSKNTATLTGQTQTAPIESLRMAVALVAAIPMIIAYICLQKYFIAGITVGAVKE